MTVPRLMTAALQLIAGLMVVSVASQAIAKKIVYVSVTGESRIAIYAVDPENGTLDHRHVMAGFGTGSLAVDPARNHLFAVIHSADSLGSFSIDRQTGKLTLVNTVVTEGPASYITTDHSGRFLLSAYFQAGKVGIHTINSDGSVASESALWITTKPRAHSIVADPTNQFVYVPYTTPDVIFQFRFNVQAGQLLPAALPQLPTATGATPRPMAFHPQEHDLAFVANE